MISFIPILYNKKNKQQSESIIKYFLIQILASRIILFLSCQQWNSFININIIIIICISLKIALFPFFYWILDIIENLKWNQIIIITFLQKISPLYIINLFFNKILLYISILSIIISSILGLNQRLVRKIIACSSINHIGWTCLSININNRNWLYYFILYSFININLIILFSLFNIFHILTLFNLKKEFLIVIIRFFSLAGLPPLTGFLNKFSIIVLLINNSFFVTFLVIIITIISLFFYLRICFNKFILFQLNYKIKSFKIIRKNLLIFSFLRNFLLFWMI